MQVPNATRILEDRKKQKMKNGHTPRDDFDYANERVLVQLRLTIAYREVEFAS
jgi:hypothetical protein